MLGENFILSSFERDSIEKFMISEYKRNKSIKLAEGDTMAQVLIDIAKVPFF